MIIDSPSADTVYTGVVPCKKGELKNPKHIRVPDGVTIQSRALAWYNDESVKALEYCFQRCKEADYEVEIEFDSENPTPQAKGLPASAVINFSYIAVPNTVFLTAKDYKGNMYGATISRGFSDSEKFYRKGANRVTVRLSGLLEPVYSEKRTYDHLMAFDAYIDHFDNTDCLGIKIRLHNGNVDSPNGDIFFKEVTLWVPSHQVIRSEWQDKDPIELLATTDEGQNFVPYALVAAPENANDNHMMRQMGQRIWSMTLGSASHEDYPAYLEDTRLVSPDNIEELYQANGYGPTSVPVGKGSYNQRIKDIEELSDSRPVGFYDMIHTPYGGPTGLWRVVLHPGAQLVDDFLSGEDLTAFRRGAFRYASRQPTYLSHSDGSIWRKELETEGSIRLRDGKFLGGFENMGFPAAKERDQILDAGVTCSYRNELENWMPIDLQHAGILAYCWLPLYWLTGDPVAEDFLTLQGELVTQHWGNHEYDNGSKSYLLSQLDEVQTNPNTGSRGGRAFGWAMFFAANAQQIQPRYSLENWLEDANEVVQKGQMPDNGAIYCNNSGKGAKVWYDYKYFVTQPMETGIEMNGYKALTDAIQTEGHAKVFHRFITGAIKYFWRNKDHTNGCWVTFPVATSPDKNLFATVDDIPEGDLPSKANCSTCPPWGETNMTPGMLWLFAESHKFFSQEEVNLLLLRLVQLYGSTQYNTDKNFLYWCGLRASLDNFGLGGSLVIDKGEKQEVETTEATNSEGSNE